MQNERTTCVLAGVTADLFYHAAANHKDYQRLVCRILRAARWCLRWFQKHQERPFSSWAFVFWRRSSVLPLTSSGMVVPNLCLAARQCFLWSIPSFTSRSSILKVSALQMKEQWQTHKEKKQRCVQKKNYAESQTTLYSIERTSVCYALHNCCSPIYQRPRLPTARK